MCPIKLRVTVLCAHVVKCTTVQQQYPADGERERERELSQKLYSGKWQEARLCSHICAGGDSTNDSIKPGYDQRKYRHCVSVVQ